MSKEKDLYQMFMDSLDFESKEATQEDFDLYERMERFRRFHVISEEVEAWASTS
tara:strand:+ start:131 stop:292 length:162 start_codon:yes stop_codon:yes gene_type:complete